MDESVLRIQDTPQGVVIPLRPLSTQLIFTVIMAISELLFISAALVLHALWECHLLKKGNALRVKSHSRRIRLINILALIMFVTLETLVSVFTKEIDRASNSEQNCVSMFARNSSSFDELEKWANHESIFLGCLTPGLNQTISVSEGSYSLDTGRVQCSEKTLLSYRHFTSYRESFVGRKVHTTKCDDIFCVGMIAEEKAVFFSSPEEPTQTFEGLIHGVWTNLSFDASAQLDVLAQELSSLYARGILNEHEVRRILFSEVREGPCSMVESMRRETLLAHWILIVAAVIWTASVLVFIATRFVQRRLLYDMRNPSHWLKKKSGVMNMVSGKGEMVVKLSAIGSEEAIEHEDATVLEGCGSGFGFRTDVT